MDFIVLWGSIGPENVEKLAGILRKKKSWDSVNLLLSSYGGSLESGYNTIRILRHYTKKLNIYIVDYAKSAATFVCLGADKLYLSDIAELGPIDPQIRQQQPESIEQFSASSHIKAGEFCADFASECFDKMFTSLTEKVGFLSFDKIISHAIDYSTKLATPLLEQLDPVKLKEYDSYLYQAMLYAVYLEQQHKELKDLMIKVKSLTFAYPSHSFVIDKAGLDQLNFTTALIKEEQRKRLRSALDENKEIVEKKGKHSNVFEIKVKDDNDDKEEVGNEGRKNKKG